MREHPHVPRKYWWTAVIVVPLAAAFIAVLPDLWWRPREGGTLPAPPEKLTEDARRPATTPLQPAQPDRLFQLIADIQRTYVRESYGEQAGENFSDDDLAEFRKTDVPRAIADSLRHDAAFLAIVLGLQSLDGVKRQQLLRSADRPLRRTWREIGRITPDGQTEAGNTAEGRIAAAVVGLAQELVALSPDRIRALSVQ